MDYQLSESELSGATSTFDTYTSVSNAETAIIEIGTGAVAAAEDLEELRKEKVNVEGGDTSETVIKTLDSFENEFPVPSAGKKTRTFLGKVKKFIQDFKVLNQVLLHWAN